VIPVGIRIYIYNFPIKIFIENRSQSCALVTVSLSQTTSNMEPEGVYNFHQKAVMITFPIGGNKALVKIKGKKFLMKCELFLQIGMQMSM
jgi:hypothetical protein